MPSGKTSAELTTPAAALEDEPEARSPSLPASFELSGFMLRVVGEIGRDEEAQLEEALGRLLSTSWGTLGVDVSGVHYVSTGCARSIAAAMRKACRTGRSVTVRAKKHALLALELAGAFRLGRIEFADGG